MKSKLILLAIMLITVTSLISCDNLSTEASTTVDARTDTTESVEERFTVTFYAEPGVVFSSHEYSPGDQIAPVEVSKEGYKFHAWCTSVDGGQTFLRAWDFLNNTLDSDLDLYATWDELVIYKVFCNYNPFTEDYRYEALANRILEQLNALQTNPNLSVDEIDYTFIRSMDDLDPTTYLQNIEQAIEEEVDVLFISLIYENLAWDIVDKARAASIPVFFYNELDGTFVPEFYKDNYYIWSDYNALGYNQGQLVSSHWNQNPDLDKDLDQTLDYLLLRQDESSEISVAYKTSLSCGLDDSLVTWNVLHELFNPTNQASDLEQALLAYLDTLEGKEVEVIICQTDKLAMSAINVLETLGLDIPVYGIGGTDLALEAIQLGKLEGTVMTDVYGVVDAMFTCAINLYHNLPVTHNTAYTLFLDQYIYIDPLMIDSTNVDDYIDSSE